MTYKAADQHRLRYPGWNCNKEITGPFALIAAREDISLS